MLTDSQRAMVEQYHNVVYKALSFRGLPASEYLDVAEERLCIAAEKFTGDPSRFGAYAFVAISRALAREAQHKHPHPSDIDEVPVAGTDQYADLFDRMDRCRIAYACKRYMTPLEWEAVQRILDGEKASNMQQDGARKRALRKCRKHLKAMTSSLPKPTCTQAAQIYGVDRSTILKHSRARKVGKLWQIDRIDLPERPKRYSKAYSDAERGLLLSARTDDAVAKQTGRSPNAVHIARWRLRKRNMA